MDEWDTAGMHVVALPANHASGQALHFVFEKDGKMDNVWAIEFLKGLGMIPAWDGFEIEI